MVTIRRLAVITAALALLAEPAGATHGGIHPTFGRSDVYFHCTGDTKVYQVNWLATLGSESSYTTWNATPPSQSVQQGAGCGGLDWGGTSNPVYDVVFKGTFTGNLRDITVRIHHLLLGNLRESESETLRLYAEVDGISIFPPGAQPNNGRTVTVTPVPSSTGASELFEFSITNLGYAIDVFNEEGELIDVLTGGVALENGNGTIEHELLVYLGLHGTALGQDPAGHKVGAWVWDTTEVPSGVTFNPPSLAQAQVVADLPVYG